MSSARVIFFTRLCQHWLRSWCQHLSVGLYLRSMSLSTKIGSASPILSCISMCINMCIEMLPSKQRIPGGGKALLLGSKDAEMPDELLAEVCVYTHAHARACAHVYACVCKHMPTHISVHISVHTCVCIAMCMSRHGSLDGSST